jgi:hypothetical protein
MKLIDIEKNKQEYIKRFNEILGHREGSKELLNYLSSRTDFFTSPASASDFLAVYGGLCQYALLLHDELNRMFSAGVFAQTFNLKDAQGKPLVTKEMIGAVALLAPLDNMLLYTTEQKNRKSYDPEVVARLQQQGETVRVDGNGKFVWESYTAYTYDDSMPIGEGIRAISFIQPFMRLKKEEMLAIRWAKGSASSGHDRGAMWATFNQSVLTIAVQNAYTTIRFIVANDNYFDYFNAGNQSYVQQNLSQPAQIQQIQQFNHQPQVAQVQPTQQQIGDNSNYNTQQHVVQTQSAPVIPSPNPSPQSISEDIQRELEDFDKVMMQ